MYHKKPLFYETNRIGKTGETAITEYYESRGIPVVDVSNDKEYQKKDIDLLINGQPVEVKTGQKIPQYQEIAVELVSNDSPDRWRDGWLNTSEAEVIIYYSPQEKKMYQLSLPELRQYVNDNKDRLKQRRVYVNEYDDIQKPSILAFVPIEELETSITHYRTIEIEE